MTLIIGIGMGDAAGAHAETLYLYCSQRKQLMISID